MGAKEGLRSYLAYHSAKNSLVAFLLIYCEIIIGMKAKK